MLQADLLKWVDMWLTIRKIREKWVYAVVQNTVDDTPQENKYRKISTNNDTSYYYENEIFEDGINESDTYDIYKWVLMKF